MDPATQPTEIKRSLVLAGGGVRLAYHAGVLIALEEAGLVFSHIDGTSGGIFCTAMRASGISPRETSVRWRTLRLSGFMDLLPLNEYTATYKLPGLGSAEGIRKKIFPSLGIDIEKIQTNAHFEATFNVCNFSKKTVECIDQLHITEDYLIAGMSLPVFMPAVKIGGDWYTDAVWIKDANLQGAMQQGAQEIWLVWCIGNTTEFLDGPLNQYVHMIEISANAGLFAELEAIRISNTDRRARGLLPVNIHMIRPEYPLPLDPDFLFNKINADTLINMGYADTKEYLREPLPVNETGPVYEATRMKSVPARLHLRQQFQGQFSHEGKSSSLQIKLSYFILEEEGKPIFRQFSSVSIDGEEFISGFRNQIFSGGKGRLESSFDFIRAGRICRLHLSMRVHSALDFLLGMDNKTCTASFGDMPAETFTCRQTASRRLENLFFLNVSAQLGWYRKLVLRNHLLSLFLNV